MQIRAIDSHVHSWDPAHNRYSWLNSAPALNRPFTLDLLEEERLAADIAGGILVQAANSREDNHWMLEIAKEFPWISGIVAWLPLQDPMETARIIEEDFSKQPLLKGVRHLIHDEADPAWLLQDEVLESLAVIARTGLCFDFVGVNLTHLETALAVINKIPELKLVLDHLNQPPAVGTLNFNYWKANLTSLAASGNIYAKISGLGTALKKGKGWTAEDIKPAMGFALTCFGESRCFCGGDWPVSSLAGSYSSAWSNYRKALADEGDINFQHKILYQNAIDFYGILDTTIYYV